MIVWAQPELAPSKTQKTGPGPYSHEYRYIFLAYQSKLISYYLYHLADTGIIIINTRRSQDSLIFLTRIPLSKNMVCILRVSVTYHSQVQLAPHGRHQGGYLSFGLLLSSLELSCQETPKTENMFSCVILSPENRLLPWPISVGQTALETVVMESFRGTINDKIGIMTTFSFQCSILKDQYYLQWHISFNFLDRWLKLRCHQITGHVYGRNLMLILTLYHSELYII